MKTIIWVLLSLSVACFIGAACFAMQAGVETGYPVVGVISAFTIIMAGLLLNMDTIIQLMRKR